MALQFLERLFADCKLHGENLVAEEVITPKDVKEFKSGKAGNSIISIGLPAYCILQALVRSAKENVDGLLFSESKKSRTILFALVDVDSLIFRRSIKRCTNSHFLMQAIT